MSAITTTPSLQVLKNRGIPVLVHQVQPRSDGVHYDRVYDATDEPVLETLFVRLTALAMAEIEERWADPTPYVLDSNGTSRPAREGETGAPREAMEVWEDALSFKPYRTIIDTFAIVWECSAQEAGKRLIDDKVDEYSTAVGAAVLMANGVEGDAVVRLLKTGVSSSKRLRAEVAEAAARAVTELEAEEAKAESLDAAVAHDTQTSPSLDTAPSSLSSVSSGADSDETFTSSGI